MSKARDYLHSLIINEVFVPSGAVEIISATGLPSPWLFDFKKVLLTGPFLQAYAEVFWTEYQSRYPFQVGGLESGALPLITAIVLAGERRGLSANGFFIRKSRKKTGTMSLIEGQLNGQPIILVDDIIHSGQSFCEQISTLARQRSDSELIGQVCEVFAILRYRDIEEYESLATMGVKVSSLFELNDFQSSLGVSNQTATTPRVPDVCNVLWRVQPGTPAWGQVLPRSELLLKDGRIYFGADNGNLLCLNQLTGTELWRYHITLGKTNRASFSSFVSCAGMIIFGSKDGNVYALDEQTGKRRWVYLEADWIQGSPGASTEFGLVFVPLSFGLFRKQGKVVALDAQSGEKKWEFNVAAPLGGGITYSAQSQLLFFGAEDGSFYALKAKSGELFWQTSLALKARGYPTIDETGQTVFIGGAPRVGEPTSDQGAFYALDTRTGQSKFIFKDFQFGTYSTPTIVNNQVYITALDKHLYCLNKKTGDLLWQKDLGARCFASTTSLKTLEGESVIGVGANNGRWQIFATKDGRPIANTYLTERILNQAIFDKSERIIYISTQANELYAFKITV